MEKKDDAHKAPEAKQEPAHDAVPDKENDATHKKLIAFLTEHKAEYKLKTHPASKTAEEAAALRGTPLCSGAKAMLVKDNSKASVKDLVRFGEHISG